MSKRKPELKLVEDTGSQLQAEELIPELPPQQSEMPFAVVEGEPMTELPRDLYIPPDALQVFLEAFEGPLDLLLYLIRKQNLDILDIPIAEITRQYMKYIEVMADLQLELAGEYLLMAAMLAEIKSRMLLPRPAAAAGQEEEDPRAELVRRLQEYERFKKAAEDIDQLARLERDTVAASAELQERKVVTLQPEVTLKEMLLAFKDVLSRAEKFAHHHISRERLSQRERMSEILSRLQTAAFFEFTQLFKPEEGRMGVTVTFIAILELMKEGLIEIVQAEAYAPIHVRTAQRHLKVVPGGAVSAEVDAENEAALAQPELEGENDIDDEDETPPDEAAQAEAAAVEGALAEAEAVAVALGVDEVVVGDVPAAPLAGDDLSVTTPPVEELTSEVAEPVVVADAEHETSEVSVAEVSEQEPVVVAFDAADVEQHMLAGEAPEDSADVVESEPAVADEASALDSQALAAPESGEQVAADAESDREAFTAIGSDDPASASDPQAFAVSESYEQVGVAAELDQEALPASEFNGPELTSDEQAFAASESHEQVAVAALEQEASAVSEFNDPASAADEQAFAASESHEQVTVVADQGAITASESEEQPASALDQPTGEVSESAEQVAVELGQEAGAGEQPAAVADTIAEVADETFSAVQETSGEAQASVVSETEVDADQGPALETVIDEHVVEEHVVPEHVVEENVVPEHIVEATAQLDQAEPVQVDAPANEAAPEASDITAEPVASADTDAMNGAVEDQPVPEGVETNEPSGEQPRDELSVSDDSVTESSSEADNSDAEPSR